MISVCLASCHGESYLPQQLASIHSQIGADDELIQMEEECLSPIRDVFDRMNRISHNFERALRMAKGDIVFLSDQDDVWEDGKVAEVLQAMSDPRVMAVVHDCRVIDADGKEIHPSYFALYRPTKSRLGAYWRSPFMGCCMAVRRQVIRQALPIPANVEYDTWLGVTAYRLGRVAYLNRPLIAYRRHGANASFCATQNTNSLLTKLRRRYYLFSNYFRRYIF